MELHLIILIGLLLIPAIIAAFSLDLLFSAIALLVCSVGLTLAMFNLGAPLAAVFELSVCAGLITVLFILTISLTRPVSGEKRQERKKEHYKRFLWLPIVVVIVGFGLWLGREQLISALPALKPQENAVVGEILWQKRGMDLVGQIIIILVGVYGVVVLFKRGKENG